LDRLTASSSSPTPRPSPILEAERPDPAFTIYPHICAPLVASPLVASASLNLLCMTPRESLSLPSAASAKGFKIFSNNLHRNLLPRAIHQRHRHQLLSPLLRQRLGTTRCTGVSTPSRGTADSRRLRSPPHIHVPFSGISASAFASCRRRSSPDPRSCTHTHGCSAKPNAIYRVFVTPDSHPARGVAPPCQNFPAHTDRGAHTTTPSIARVDGDAAV
jgi:hypothetical protein